MTISMQTSSQATSSTHNVKSPAPNRQSNRRRHSARWTKSISLRQWPAASGWDLSERRHAKPPPPLPPLQATEVELARVVSINHDAEGHSKWQQDRGLQKPLPPIATSGMRTKNSTGSKHHPQMMISPKESKSLNGRRCQPQKHLKLAAAASGTPAQKSASALVMLAAALMVAWSCFFNANLVGHCNCDTLSGHNPFSGGRATRSQTLASSARIERRQQPSAAAHQMDLKLASIESQHFGAGHSRPLSSTYKLDKANKEIQATRTHDDFLRDILASHEKRGGGGGAKTSNKSQRPPASLPSAGSSKADFDLRKIMLMHEQAVAPPASSRPLKLSSDVAATQLKRPQAKILSVLPRDLLVSSSSKIMSMLPSNLAKKTNSSSQAELTAAVSTTKTISPFSQRASAKNYLMSSLLGMGKMLINQPNSPDQQQRQQQQKDSNKAHTPTTKTSNSKSLETKLKAGRPVELLAKAIAGGQQRSSTPAAPSDEQDSSSSSTTPKEETKSNLGETKKNSLVDGAAGFAQAYLKDSLRDLLTLTQLPIFSGGPVSTAPSELEPGGKKWLANKQAADQIRGNRTNTIEDLLRYIYILGNVGVRRKRDPLRVLSQASRPLNALSSGGQQPVKKPLLKLLDVANLSSINSIMKFRQPNILTGTKLSSLLGTSNDQIKSRGVMWEMATDPTLAVTMMHLLERASVALPLGFLLMPFVRMTRHPLGGISLDRILPARASHRSVDLEELAKRLDMVDKILSRSMRPTHRDASSFMG